jgi:hypothetical protein
MAEAEVFLREEGRYVRVPITAEGKPGISEQIQAKWQKSLTTLAAVFNVPAGLIMKIHQDTMNVFLRAEVEGNPYPPNGKDQLGHGLYCETVIGRNQTLSIPDSLTDENWKDNPDVKLNMSSYLGMPLAWPDGDYFGTICVLDSKEVNSNPEYVDLMRIYKRDDRVGFRTGAVYPAHPEGRGSTAPGGFPQG